jgi:hypothetical protein
MASLRRQSDLLGPPCTCCGGEADQAHNLKVVGSKSYATNLFNTLAQTILMPEPER